MNKVLLLLFTAAFFYNCASKPKVYPHYVLGIKDSKERKLFDRDSLHVVTPAVEITYLANNTSHRKYDYREALKSFVIETLKSELNKNSHFDLSLMSEDYRSVNRVLEFITYEKYRNPKWIVKAPEEILISEEKYTLLISMYARYGDQNNGVIYFCVINNKDKIYEIVDRYNIKGSAIDKEAMVKRIQKALNKIIKG